MSRYELVSLGELVARRTERKGAKTACVFTASAQFGLVDQERFFGRVVAGADQTKYFIVEPGDFVYSKSYSSSAPMGAVLRNETGQIGVVSPLYVVFRPTSARVLPEYLTLAFHSQEFLNSLTGLVREGARAHGAVNISAQDFLQALIPVPATSVQRRIVDLLSAADRVVDAAKKEHLAAQRLREQLLINGMQSLSADPRSRAAKLGDVASTQLGKMLNTASQTGSGARPYLRAANIPDWGIVDTADLRTMDFSDDELEKFSVQPGDLLVTEGGAAGRCAVYRGEKSMCFQNHIHRVRADAKATTNEFLALVLEYLSLTGQLDPYCSTTTIKMLSASSLKSVEFQLPALVDQSGLVQSVAACTAKVVALHAQRERASQLRDQLLHDLLSGSHTIPESYDRFLAKATS